MARLPDGNATGFEMLKERIETALRFGAESPSVEFKAGGTWDARKIAIIKTVLAMSNLIDGGVIIIGKPEDDTTASGVSDSDLDTYDPDVIRDQIDGYASPRAIVSIARFEFDSVNYIGIAVAEFEEVPVICKQPAGAELRSGGVYTRPFTGRPKSTLVTSAEEMRSVLELAVDKGIQKFEATAARRGFVKSSTDEAAYAGETRDLDDA